MRIAGEQTPDDLDKGKRAIRSAIDLGYTQFDLADIYGNGSCERLVGEVLEESPDIRDNILITTKCGIRRSGDPNTDAPQRYDFSAEHIKRSVEDSLRRLGIDQIDLLLLHRPDVLFRADEVASALLLLKSEGKVGNFGVSNFLPSQVDLLRSVFTEPLLVNQVEINIHNISAISNGTLDQCQMLGIIPQAWSPIAGVAYPAWGNTFSDDDEVRIRNEIQRQSGIYEVQGWVIVLAWLLTHPATIMPIIGSTNPSRIDTARRALDLEYTREDWYRLLEARNGHTVA